MGLAAAMTSLLVLGACVAPRSVQQPVEEDGCRVAAAGDGMVGSWLSVRKQSGVAGELRTHFVLNADGTMRYEEQLARSGRAPQGLAETGCWWRDGESLVLRTMESNGSPVDREDPIYLNRYRVSRMAADRLVLQASDGTRLDAKRMPPDYRLPW